MASRETLPKYEDAKTIDYLEEDSEIPTQRYAILSFISPEKVIKQKQESDDMQCAKCLSIFSKKANNDDAEHYNYFIKRRLEWTCENCS